MAFRLIQAMRPAAPQRGSFRRAGALSLCVVACFCIAGGCQSDNKRLEKVRSNSPVVRSAAIVELEEQGDMDSVQILVSMLDDPDRAVRMYAILALRRLTNEDYGYRYYATETDRASSIAAWREALREGSVTIDRSRPEPAEPTTEDAQP